MGAISARRHQHGTRLNDEVFSTPTDKMMTVLLVARRSICPSQE
jgi:hypothetical protein